MPDGIRRLDESKKTSGMTYIHPAWHSFIKYCESIRFGEIDRLKIQDGLPMLAEEVKKKIKFTR